MNRKFFGVLCLFIFWLWGPYQGVAQRALEKTKHKFSVSDPNILFTKGVVIIENKSLKGIQENYTLLRKLPEERSIIQVKGYSKAIQTLQSNSVPINNSWKLQGIEFPLPAKIEVLVKFNDPNLVIKQKDWNVLEQKQDVFRIAMKKKALLDCINDSNVIYIGKESFTIKEEAKVLDLNLIPNRIVKVQTDFPSLVGQDIKIGLREKTFDTSDIDLIDKLVETNLTAVEQSDHAAQMATILVGGGLTFVNGRGVLPKSKLVSSDYVTIFPDDTQIFIDNNITIQNHSYGSDIEAFYGVSAEQYDRHCFENPKILHVISSGNSGLETPQVGPYSGLTGRATLTGSFKQSKNTLLVGAVDTTGTHTPFASSGPAFDGRIKPEVVAYSTVGTSNSTALVSGIAGILTQAYQQEHSVSPNSALVKALLINGAEDVEEIGPDFKTGFGNVNAHKSLESLNNNWYLEHTILKGAVQEHSISVPANSVNLKVTLVWTDAPANANDAVALVNDLDLEILSPDNTSFLPWILDSTPQESNLSLPATTGKDHRNTVEQISIPAPESGVFKLKIDANAIASASQHYAIVYHFEQEDTFEWDYPLLGSNMPYDGETGSYFRWNSTYTNQFGKLEISYDDGNSWQTIEHNLDLKKGFYRWNSTNKHAVAKAKITLDALEFETEPFVVSNTLSVSSGFYCKDSIMVQWPSQPGAETYQVLKFNTNKYETIRNTSDTLLILENKEENNTYYKVIPQFSTGSQSIGSYYFKPENLGQDCFLTSFYGLKENNGVALFANMTSFYTVQSVKFEKEIDGFFEVIAQFNSPTNKEIVYKDLNTLEGANNYRFTVDFEDNAQIISEQVTVFYLKESTAIVFPNPVLSGEFLTVLTNNLSSEESVMRLYDRTGKLMYTIGVSDQNQFKIQGNILPGMYLYTVTNATGTSRGKLMVQ